MKKLTFENILDVLVADEGEVWQIYGLTGSGKTYTATCDILRDLKRGKVVYASWKVNWHGYDQRKVWWCLLLGLFGLKKNFMVIPKENFHFFDLRELIYSNNFYNWLATLTSCKIYIDEGHVAFDSYEKTTMKMERRLIALDTRHYDRALIIITQRPTALHVNMRGNVHKFMKLEAFRFLFFWQYFVRSEYQMTTNDNIPTDEDEPISTKKYWCRKKIYKIYNSKYRRSGVKESQVNFAEFYRLTWQDVRRIIFREKKILNELQTTHEKTT